MTLAFSTPIRAVRVDARKFLPQYPWSSDEDDRVVLIGEKATSSVPLAYTSNRRSGRVDLWGSDGLLELDLETQSLVRQVAPT